MKQTSSIYAESVIGKQVNTLATCFKVVLNNGKKLGFTTHTRNITFAEESDLVYRTASFTPTAVSKSSAMNVDNMNADLLIDHENIKDEDLERGIWNNAKVYVFRFNWAIKPYLMANIDKVIDGSIGEMKRQKGKFVAEFRSKSQYLQNNIIDVTKSSCNAQFGDNRCKIDLINHTYTDTVLNLTNNRLFNGTTLNNPDSDFNGGIIKFITGQCTGFEMEVKSYVASNKQIELQLPMNYNIAIGDQFQIVRGCNKTKTRCKEFNNIVNFRGFSFVPGLDALTGGNS